MLTVSILRKRTGFVIWMLLVLFWETTGHNWSHLEEGTEPLIASPVAMARAAHGAEHVCLLMPPSKTQWWKRVLVLHLYYTCIIVLKEVNKFWNCWFNSSSFLYFCPNHLLPPASLSVCCMIAPPPRLCQA